MLEALTVFILNPLFGIFLMFVAVAINHFMRKAKKSMVPGNTIALIGIVWSIGFIFIAAFVAK